MKVQLLISCFPLVITLLCLGGLLTTLTWLVYENNGVDPNVPKPQRKRPPRNYNICKGCKKSIEKIMQRYSETWKMQKDNYLKVRTQLSTCCNGSDQAFITQANTPVGYKIFCDGNKKSIEVSPEIFSTFVKETFVDRANGRNLTSYQRHLAARTLASFRHPGSSKLICEGYPLPGKRLNTCAVVGNGGILSDSHCGEMIDSAQFVIRCNLPPLDNGYEKDVGVKTDLVTANPSILREKYKSLTGSRRQFVDNLRIYGKSLMLLPAFSFSSDTVLSLRVAYTLKDFESPMQPIYFNPEYLQRLDIYWRDQGLKGKRLSTGLMMASLALELCENVHLYGFWPFSNHPDDLYTLTNHYYDNRKALANFHAMPVEFEMLLKLHSEGVLKLHLGDCRKRRT